jgi:hypothetical protein
MGDELGSHGDSRGVVPLRRIIRVVTLASVLVLPLVSCDILFVGSFSSDLAQATARIDLSSSISAADGGSFTLSVIRSGKFEYVLLFSSLSFDGSLPHLLVLSPELKLKNSYSLNDIDAATGTVPSFSGNAAIAHLADGNVVIGNLQTTPSDSGLALDQKLTVAPVQLSRWAIEGPQPSYLTWSNFFLDYSQQLSYFEYAGDWNSPRTSKSHFVSSPGNTRYDLEGVFTDPEDSLNNGALMVFAESNTQQEAFHFIQVPKNADFINQFAGPPIMENPAYTGTQFVKNNLEHGTICMTSDSIIGYDPNAQSLVRFTPANPGGEARLRIPNRPKDMLLSFSFSGGYYCTWDPVTRILTRYERWW